MTGLKRPCACSHSCGTGAVYSCGDGSPLFTTEIAFAMLSGLGGL